MKHSWRTTVAGILTILGALASAGKALVDNDPATNPDWMLISTAVATGWGLITARDAKVSSEAMGLDK